MQLEMMSRLNMRTLSGHLPSVWDSCGPAFPHCPTIAVLVPPALIDDTKLYPKIYEVLERVHSSAKDPGHNIHFNH